MIDSQLLSGLLMGCGASVCLNIGKGVQKMKVHVLKKGRRAFNRENRGDLLVWIVGMSLTTAATVFFSKALQMTDKSSIVSSLNGIGLIGLALFSYFVLKERVGARELAAIFLVISGTALVQLFNVRPEGGQNYSLPMLIGCSVVVIFVFGSLVLFAIKTGKGHAFIFGSLAGTLIGFALILGDIALIAAGGDFLGQLHNPYPYVAITAGTTALIVTQFAFFRGSAVFVVPTVNSFIIIVPMVAEVFVFGVVLVALQYLGAAMIVAGVIILTTGAGREAAGAVG